jgi:hypothetical protein
MARFELISVRPASLLDQTEPEPLTHRRGGLLPVRALRGRAKRD